MKRFFISICTALVLSLCVTPFTISTKGQTPTPESPSSPQDTAYVYLPMAFGPSVPPSSWTPGAGWPTLAGNPARTSWSADQPNGNLRVIWYRPIEAYISQNVQIIASDNLIFISTAKGLYALNPANGAVVWRYDTEMPLGNSPTIVNGILYVGGYDRKIHALNAQTGAHLWEFAGAEAGYDTNPLVVDGKVFAGNRDGYMYAIGAHGAPQQGQLLWKYKTGGPIHLSAAYKDGVIYFAADDNYAYALNAANGALVWKSAKLPGDGYHSYWPVIFRDKVIFSAAFGYRNGIRPGIESVVDPNGGRYDHYNIMQRVDLFPTEPDGTLLGPTLPSQSWAHDQPVIDGSRIMEYLENNPNADPYKHKPWRRTMIVLNTANGTEYTMDVDRDGYPEYAPAAYWGTHSGNQYPPIVGPDNILYFNNIWQKYYDAQGKVMGWNIGTPYLSVIGAQGAIAEPQAISGGGTLIYRSICCDRVGDYYDIYRNGIRTQNLWGYDLDSKAPGYDDMWTILPGWPRLQGWYKGNTNSINGIYHNHGDQNPIIPYGNMLFIHRSNAIIAYGPGTPIGKLPLLQIQSAPSTSLPLSVDNLKARLETEVSKMIQAGHLRPGYYNQGNFMYDELADYFKNPGETLYTLSIAYPHLSPSLQQQTRAYLQREFQDYFDPVMYVSIGWAEGAAREWMPLPPEVQADLGAFPKRTNLGGFSWSYPPHNFYAMWKYVQLVEPGQAVRAYDLAKSKLQVPVPSVATTDYFRQKPYELNAYIAGYVGFLRLQELAGRVTQDSQLRTQVTNELNRLYELRVSIFSKDTYWVDTVYHKRSLNIARNFIYLVPELGSYLRQNARPRLDEAIAEYQYIAPYWFVSRYESMMNEGVMSPLYNYPAIFQAKALIQNASRNELSKYLDVPAFEKGDLFYIQNLVAAIQAP